MIQIALILSSLCLVGFFLVKKGHGREFVNVYLINFVLQFLVLDLVNEYLNGYRSKNDSYYIAMAMTASFIYVASIWLLSAIPSFKANSRSAFDSLLSAGYPFARYAILLWLSFRVYLYAKYGIRSFAYLDLFNQGGAQKSPLSYAETVLMMSLLYLANGAVMALVIQAAVRGYRAISIVEWSLLILFFGFVLFGEAPLGVRRTLILYAMIFITTYSISREVPWKVLSLSLLLGAVGVALIGYYSRIRFNAANPEVFRLLSSGSISDVLSGIVAYLTPGPQPTGTYVFRSGGFDYLATCIRLVEQSGQIMGGSLLLFSFYKVIPSAFYAGKSSLDMDEVVSKFFRTEDTDYAANILANLYVDIGVLSVVLAPLLWWSALYVMLLILGKAKANGPLALSASGMIFGMLSSVEGSLNSLFVYVRDILVVLPVFYVMGLVFGRSKGAASVHDTSAAQNNPHLDLSAMSRVQSRRYQLLSDGSGRQE